MMRDLSMHIMDIVQNSIAAGAARIKVEVCESQTADLVTIIISDDGRGMTPETLEAVRDPFVTSRTTRKVGLGLPMLEQTCVQCGGRLDIQSQPGQGTTITAVMKDSSIDRPPIGDLAGTLVALVVTNENAGFELTFTYTNGREPFVLDTAEIKAALDGVPLSEPSVMAWLKDFVREGIAGGTEG